MLSNIIWLSLILLFDIDFCCCLLLYYLWAGHANANTTTTDTTTTTSSSSTSGATLTSTTSGGSSSSGSGTGTGATTGTTTGTTTTAEDELNARDKAISQRNAEVNAARLAHMKGNNLTDNLHIHTYTSHCGSRQIDSFICLVLSYFVLFCLILAFSFFVLFCCTKVWTAEYQKKQQAETAVLLQDMMAKGRPAFDSCFLTHFLAYLLTCLRAY